MIQMRCAYNIFIRLNDCNGPWLGSLILRKSDSVSLNNLHFAWHDTTLAVSATLIRHRTPKVPLPSSQCLGKERELIVGKPLCKAVNLIKRDNISLGFLYH